MIAPEPDQRQAQRSASSHAERGRPTSGVDLLGRVVYRATLPSGLQRTDLDLGALAEGPTSWT